MPFRIIRGDEDNLKEQHLKSISEHRNLIISFVLNGDEARVAELRESLEELDYLFENARGIDDDIALARLKLAGAALHLQQVVIPGLQQLGEQCLRTAGASAVRDQCAGHTVNGQPIPSKYKLPEEYKTVVGKIKAAVRG